MSLTQDALKWLSENPGKTVYAAAKHFDISSSALYKAIKQQEATKNKRCPCCGQVIRSDAPRKPK